MCGLLYARGAVPTPALLMSLRLASQRGGHSWGVWHSRAGCDDYFVKGLGRLASTYLPSKFDVLLAHARLATTSPWSPTIVEDAQPLIGNRFALAHNGVVPGYTGVGCDSQLLLEAAEERDGTPTQSLAHSLVVCGLDNGRTPCAMILVDRFTGAVATYAHNLPLKARTFPDGAVLIASRLEVK